MTVAFNYNVYSISVQDGYPKVTMQYMCALCAVFTPKNFPYGVAEAFCCAQNIVLAAAELWLFSCIAASGEETFDHKGAELIRQWNVPESYSARCFALSGYPDGEYPAGKPRLDGRTWIVG